MSIFGEFTTAFCVAPRKPERTAAPIDSGRKLPVEEVVARVGDHRCHGISAQSPPRFGTATSRPDPPYLGDAGSLPQALVSDLRPLEVDRIVCDSFPRPADNLPRQYWPPC